jgi:hypothetical protein
VNPECCPDAGGPVSTTGKTCAEFVCRGCYRVCSANPRLKPGEQEYCSRPSCQRLRMDRWEQERLQGDPEYRDHRRKAKAASRRKCAAADAACRRVVRAQERADPPQSELPEPPPSRPSTPATSKPVVPKLPIQPGWFLIRPANAPESATQTVEISVVWSCPLPMIEQVSSAPETDALLLRRSASGAADKRAS